MFRVVYEVAHAGRNPVWVDADGDPALARGAGIAPDLPEHVGVEVSDDEVVEQEDGAVPSTAD